MFAGEHSSSYTHVLYHVGMTALFVAAVYAVILLLFKPLLRKGGRGGRPGKGRAGGVANRQQRRQERAMAKRKRHY